MATLKAVLETTTGLYRDADSGKGYLRHELLQSLSSEILSSQVQLQRVDRGTYILSLSDRKFELLSRRRTPRREDAPVI
ncbi:MAG: hypothetical protein ACR2JC_13050 [Chloroflexota bacterium]|nr:MAG: hypothetical protein DLM70_06260 [Chloroflexota bacterium]